MDAPDLTADQVADLEARAERILRRAVEELQADAEDLDQATAATILEHVAAKLARGDVLDVED